jgi:hypothetical protein
MTDTHLVLIIIRCHIIVRRHGDGLARRVRDRCQAELRRRYAR